jgi:hypothetical protein
MLVVFVPANYTNELKLADIIIQRPLKHAFKANFNKWITNIIKHQIYKRKKLHIDLKMNNLKPTIYVWLHAT